MEALQLTLACRNSLSKRVQQPPSVANLATSLAGKLCGLFQSFSCKDLLALAFGICPPIAR